MRLCEGRAALRCRGRPSCRLGNTTGWAPSCLFPAVTGGRRSPLARCATGSPAAIGDPPDRAVAVLADQQRAVARDRNADRAAPHAAIVDNEAGQKILVLAGRRAAPQQYANNLVAGPLGAVPRTVERGEDVAAVSGRELRAIGESHLH